MHKFGLSAALIFFATPAFAIDCASARSAAEKAICSDAEARGADDALGKVYTQLRNSLPSDAATGLRRSQIEWIRVRDATCAVRDAIKPFSRCLAEKSRERLRFLDGKPRAGDTSVSLFRPIFIFRPANNGSAPVSVQAIRFTGDGEWQSKINALIDAAVKDALSDAEAGKDNPGKHDNYYVTLDIDLGYASSRMLSVQVDSGSYLGQAHPDSRNYNINFERGMSKELTFNDLLDDVAAKQVFAFCRSQIAKQKIDRARDEGNSQKNDVELEAVAQSTKDLSLWRFKSSIADVDYGAYAFGGYGQCMCSCAIPYSMLHPIAKKAFPLP